MWQRYRETSSVAPTGALKRQAIANNAGPTDARNDELGDVRFPVGQIDDGTMLFLRGFDGNTIVLDILGNGLPIPRLSVSPTAASCLAMIEGLSSLNRR